MSVLVNLLLTVAQLIVGWFAHSQSLIAHGLHSFSDLLSDFLPDKAGKRFFERCRTEWMRFAGYDQSALATEAGIGFVARKASCEYLRPARLDDELTIALEVEKLSDSRRQTRRPVSPALSGSDGSRDRDPPCGTGAERLVAGAGAGAAIDCCASGHSLS